MVRLYCTLSGNISVCELTDHCTSSLFAYLRLRNTLTYLLTFTSTTKFDVKQRLPKRSKLGDDF